jgi:hypothetical protein
MINDLSLSKAYSRLLLPSAPYYSGLMNGGLETRRDPAQGLRYNMELDAAYQNQIIGRHIYGS